MLFNVGSNQQHISPGAGRPSRILYISAVPPIPAKIGPARRNFHVIEQLSRFYDVSVLSLAKVDISESFGNELTKITASRFVLARAGPKARFLRKVWRTLTRRCDFLPAVEPGLRRLAADHSIVESFDVVFLSCVLLRSLPLPKGIRIIGDTHNVEFDVLRRTRACGDSFLQSQYARLQESSTRREEAGCARKVDLLLATSERDRDLFRREMGIQTVAVVPNGIDVSEFVPPQSEPNPEEILFTGLMSYYPNEQAVRWFLDKVFPLVLRTQPDTRIVIAGANPRPWLLARAGRNVEITGPVPDMRPYIARAAVVIAPLHIGGGTRVKILEALAMAKPVVSTEIGAEGLRLRHGQSIFLANDPTSFADGVIQVLRNPPFGQRLGHTGRVHVLQYFNWDRIGEHLDQVLRLRLGLFSRHEANDLRDSAPQLTTGPV
jgi:polysaccharide biosynthesis protein PslH